MVQCKVEEEKEEVGLQGRRRWQGPPPHQGNGAIIEEKTNKNNVHMEKNEVDCYFSKLSTGEEKLKNVDIGKILSRVIRYQDEQITLKDGISCEEEHILFKLLTEGTEELVNIYQLEGSREQVIEVEFERAVGKLDQHVVHCPDCDSCVTKVVLRKRKRANPCDLFRCLSCLSIFIPTGATYPCHFFNLPA